jgi:hypothetical protein
MQENFKGNGGSAAGVCIRYEYDLKTGKILDLSVYSGDRNDLTDATASCNNIQAGDLVIRDLGYCYLNVFEHFRQEKAFFLSKLKSNTIVYDSNGDKICFKMLRQKISRYNMEYIQLNVHIGKKHRMPVRMVVYPVDEQTCQKRIRDREKEAKKRGSQVSEETRERYRLTILVTNAPEETLPADRMYAMYKLRWQIELIFKSWKSTFCLRKTWKIKEERYLCLLYSRLLLIVINMQIVWYIQLETDIRNAKGKAQLLSFYKSLRTLSTLFTQLLAALYSGKQDACEFLLYLRKKLSKNHYAERRKNKIGLNKIIELFICVSEE